MRVKMVIGFLAALLFFATTVGAAATWREDFERLCGTTERADSMSLEELKQVVVEADQLLETIEKDGGEQKKLYLFRLRKCRDFFAYMLSAKEMEPAKE
jgi:site-specific recombinase XerC